MQTYPFISVIFLGDNSISEIDLSLSSLKEINYPQDQLEFYLIVPYHRPLSRFVEDCPKLRIIRFDETIEWSPLFAQLEGLSFSNGDYVQIFNGNYALHSNWLKTGLEYLKNRSFISVSSNDVLKNIPGTTQESFKLADGLYNTKILKKYINGNKNKLIRSGLFKDSNNNLRISAPMINLRKTKHNQISQQQFFNNRIRSIFSKYVLAK